MIKSEFFDALLGLLDGFGLVRHGDRVTYGVGDLGTVSVMVDGGGDVFIVSTVFDMDTSNPGINWAGESGCREIPFGRVGNADDGFITHLVKSFLNICKHGDGSYDWRVGFDLSLKLVIDNLSWVRVMRGLLGDDLMDRGVVRADSFDIDEVLPMNKVVFELGDAKLDLTLGRGHLTIFCWTIPKSMSDALISKFGGDNEVFSQSWHWVKNFSLSDPNAISDVRGVVRYVLKELGE